GSFIYRPKRDFHGTDTFTYAVADTAAQQSSGSGQSSGAAPGPVPGLVGGSGSAPPSNPPTPGPGQVATVTIEVGSEADTTAATGRVQLFVGPQGDVVIATDDRYQLLQDVSLTVPAPGVLTNDVDPDGDKLGLSVVKNVDHGKLELNQDGSFLYAPAEHFTG